MPQCIVHRTIKKNELNLKKAKRKALSIASPGQSQPSGNLGSSKNL
ncbi:hypothetical protein LEP1GSC083_0067 [Leptospira interrogans serovar Pyrogenes str. L0374]|nr:hypothetical protein LEP1GSC083_0067 [Leptospira interrogans serovar Pyrogenes str. L0374]EMN62251.1 hypothetical protein LEP1GSC092_0300 [Leptospira interrogans serovar Pyrogenes str. R168]